MIKPFLKLTGGTYSFSAELQMPRPDVEGNGNPLQHSCLENPRDGGAWWAAIYGVAQSQTRLKQLSSSSSSSSRSWWWKEKPCLLSEPYELLGYLEKAPKQRVRASVIAACHQLTLL